MLHKKNWAFWLGETISLTAAFVLITVSVLAFNVGLSTAHYDQPDAEEKQPPPIEEEFNAPDPCAEADGGLLFARNEEPQPQEKDCGDVDTNPAKEVEPLDPCGSYVLARNAETIDLDEACEVPNRQI